MIKIFCVGKTMAFICRPAVADDSTSGSSREQSPEGGAHRRPRDDSPEGGARRRPRDDSPVEGARRRPRDDSPEGGARRRPRRGQPRAANVDLRRRAVQISSSDEDIPAVAQPPKKSNTELARECYTEYLASMNRSRDIESKLDRALDKILERN
jgi:hypothetical protein